VHQTDGEKMKASEPVTLHVHEGDLHIEGDLKVTGRLIVNGKIVAISDIASMEGDIVAFGNTGMPIRARGIYR
jgi:hypothetical protein